MYVFLVMRKNHTAETPLVVSCNLWYQSMNKLNQEDKNNSKHQHQGIRLFNATLFLYMFPKQLFNPSQKDGRNDCSDNGPPANGVEHGTKTLGRVGILGATGGCRSVRQRAVDQDGVGSIDLGDRDDGLVEGTVSAIANDVGHISAVGVLVTAAGGVGVAATDDGLRLFLVGRAVVEGVRVGVGIHVRAVKPDTGPKGESRYTGTDEQGRNAGF